MCKYSYGDGFIDDIFVLTWMNKDKSNLGKVSVIV